MKDLSPLNQASVLSLKPKRVDLKDPSQQQELKEAAKMYEKHFLREMVKQMRTTVPEGGLLPKSMGESIYQESVDHEYVENWGEKGGIGLADLVYKQVMLQMGLDEHGNRQPLRPIGPVPMENMKGVKKSNQPYLPIENQNQKSELNFEIDVETQNKPTSLLAPWQGKVIAHQQISPTREVLILEHDNTLKSKIVIHGGLSKTENLTGLVVEQGQAIGGLRPDSNKLIWNVS